jgi:hypothetical protein
MEYIGLIIVAVFVFIGCVLLTRWIFGIDKIINALQTQNHQSLMQIRLLKKMLINQGTSFDEIDNIMDNGNPKPKN